MNTLLQDIRYSLRMLAHTPAAAIVAILSLALGIGANTAIFSLMNAVILRSLPIREPGQLLRLTTPTQGNPEGLASLSIPIYQQIRKNQQVFSSLFAWTGGAVVNIEANGAVYVASMSTVTGDYFSTLGVQPILGRGITPADLHLDAGFPAAVAVIGYGCWQSRYHGDPAVVGKTIRVEDRLLTIIGVMPESFTGLIIDAAADVTVPVGYSGRLTYRDPKNFGFEVFARLKPGTTIEQARAQMEAIWPSVMQASLPESFDGPMRAAFLGRRIRVSSASTGSSFMRQRYSRPLYVLMAMVGLLLLVACVNLANLMLARAAGRRQELGIRAALGAGKWRIVQQMLTESLLLSLSGAALGMAFAFWASRVLINTMWTGLVPLNLNASPDIRVLVFTALVSVLTGLLFGISPAWSIFRTDLLSALQQNAGRVHGGAGRLGTLLIGAQVALSLVLVIGAILFVRSLHNQLSLDLGFRKDNWLVVQLFPQHGGEGRPMPNRVAYYRELSEHLERLPGVEAVNYSHMGPMLNYEYKEPVSISSSQAPSLQAVFELTGPEFFHFAGIGLLSGREFDWHDGETTQPVAIISESLSRRLFPASNPIGQRIDYGDRKGLEIVGVVKNASFWIPQSRNPMVVYSPLMQFPTFNSSFVDVRTKGAPASILPAIRREIESLGRQTVLRADTVDERMDRVVLLTDRIMAMLAPFFGGLALLLASIGLYGLMSYTVARRTSEIGLRVALGANPASVQALVMKEALWMVLGGLIVGIPAALACTRLVSGMVYGIAANDGPTMFVSCCILVCAALLAGYLPARRASRIDPMTALRSE